MGHVQRVWNANWQVYGADQVWRQMNREGVLAFKRIFGSPTWTRTRDLRINRKLGSSKTLQNQRFIAEKLIRAINRVIS